MFFKGAFCRDVGGIQVTAFIRKNRLDDVVLPEGDKVFGGVAQFLPEYLDVVLA